MFSSLHCFDVFRVLALGFIIQVENVQWVLDYYDISERVRSTDYEYALMSV